MRVPFQLSLLASAVVLAGCGGGGPGGSNVNTGGSNNYIRPSVSYSTPSAINHFTPTSGTGAYEARVYAQDLNKDSADEVVVSGWDSTRNNRGFNMQIYGWNTGAFTNETTGWFADNDNQIIGGGTLNFADFNGDGNLDMYVAPDSDTNQYYAEALVYFNNGNDKFTRTKLNLPSDTWAHDASVYDFNNDGFDDIFTVDYNQQMSISYGSANGEFTTFTTDKIRGASSISVGDYLGDGSKTIILTDAGPDGDQDTMLFRYAINNNKLELQKIADLPASRFTLPKWSNVKGTTPAHGVRNFSMDFNNDGLMDVIVFDWLWDPNNPDVRPSEIQFLINNGEGSFADVTDDYLVNFDNQRSIGYNPRFIDVNNDGLTDIFLSTSDYTGGEGQRDYHDSTYVLIQTAEGKFVEKFADIGSDFSNQITNMTDYARTGATQPIQIVVGPDGHKYLFGTVITDENPTQIQTRTYLAKVGSTNTITPQAVSDVINSVWPYLTNNETNEVLARTSPLSINGTQVVDIDRALEPIGELEVSSTKISGSLSIAGVNGANLSQVTALDAIGRNYNVNLSTLTNNHSPSLEAVSNTRALGFTAQGNNDTYKFGADSSSLIDSEWRFGFGVSRQKQNPWLNFDGMFGSVNSTQTVEFDLNKQYNNGIWHRAGVMQYQTDFTPGLVTRVDDLWAGYAVLGYKDNGINLYGGLKPTLFSGSVGLRLPTDIDNQGNLMYTDHTVSVRNQALGFLGFDYKFVLDLTQKLEYNMNAQIDSAGNKQGNFTAGLPW